MLTNAVVAKRINYIDALRGFTILLVVFGHVLLFSFDIPHGTSVLGEIFITFRMPMFFFISGYISYKPIEHWTFPFYLKKIKDKAIVQLVPTLFFLTIFFICIKHNPNSGYNGFFDGYWFTICLFEMLAIYFTISLFCKNSSEKLFTPILLFLAVISVFILSFYRGSGVLWDLFCTTELLKYFHFFAFGTLAMKYSVKFMNYINNDLIKFISLLLFIILFIICFYTDIKDDYNIVYKFFHDIIIRYLGLFIIFTFFYKYKSFFNSDNKYVTILTFVGRRTLDIYLLHYFFIPDLSFLNQYISGNDQILSQLVLGLFVSVCIVILCLVCSYIIRTSDILAKYLFGAKINSKEQNV